MAQMLLFSFRSGGDCQTGLFLLAFALISPSLFRSNQQAILVPEHDSSHTLAAMTVWQASNWQAREIYPLRGRHVSAIGLIEGGDGRCAVPTSKRYSRSHR